MTHAGRTWPDGVGARHLAGKLITLCGALGELADVPADATCPECRRALERRRDALADLLTAELDPVSELLAVDSEPLDKMIRDTPPLEMPDVDPAPLLAALAALADLDPEAGE